MLFCFTGTVSGLKHSPSPTSLVWLRLRSVGESSWHEGLEGSELDRLGGNDVLVARMPGDIEGDCVGFGFANAAFAAATLVSSFDFCKYRFHGVSPWVAASTAVELGSSRSAETSTADANPSPLPQGGVLERSLFTLASFFWWWRPAASPNFFRLLVLCSLRSFGFRRKECQVDSFFRLSALNLGRERLQAVGRVRF